MKIAVSGLGRMGSQIARKLAEGGHDVIAHNRSPGPVEEAEVYGASPAYSKNDVIKSFKHEQVIIWVMMPAEILNSQVEEWLQLVPKGSIMIDGGNSDFRLTRIMAEKVSTAGSVLIDIGTSGGIWGYKNGFSMMAGGNNDAYKTVEPILTTLATPGGSYDYFGDSGAGHFVKMVHNAVEYGMMESIAEGYRMLKEGPYNNLDLAAAGEVWQHGSVVNSWLNELAKDALKDDPDLKDIEGRVAESGEARWTLEVAKEIGLPMPAIQSAFDVRLASQKGEINFATKMLAAMRNKFGGHKLNP